MMKSMNIALIIFLGIFAGRQAGNTADRLFGTITEEGTSPTADVQAAPLPQNASPITVPGSVMNKKLIPLPGQTEGPPSQNSQALHIDTASEDDQAADDSGRRSTNESVSDAANLDTDAMEPQMEMLFSQLSKLASLHRHKRHATGASDELSCLGMETVVYRIDGPGIVKYVDPKSDLYSKLAPGDSVLTIDGETMLQYHLGRHNYGNANTTAQVLVRHQNGVTEQLTCQRHPINYFTPYVQRGLLPY